MALIAVASVPALAAAQRCAGTASFAGGGPRFSSGASFTAGSRTISAGITLGRDKSLFAGGSVAHTMFNGSGLFSGGLQGSIGYQFALGARAQICPLVSVGRSSAMMFPGRGRTDWSSTGYGLGAMIGFTAAASRHVEVIPSLGLQYVAATTRASSSAYGTQLASGRWQGSMGNLSLTTGFVFHKAITVSPSVALPLRTNYGRPLYGVGLSYNFGHQR
ncbi:MAG: hypothetical protein ACYC3L_11045 [Gemmatimonadaceae bacterium]